MAETNISFSGSIPQMYDRYLGPVLFEPYAADLARRVATAHATGPVLEMACGTGIVTQQLRAHLALKIKIVATDLSQPMLDYAKTKLPTLKNVTGDKQISRPCHLRMPNFLRWCVNSA